MCQQPQRNAKSIDSVLLQAVVDGVIDPEQAEKIRESESYHSAGRDGFDISTICELLMPILMEMLPVILPVLLNCFDDCPNDEQVRQALRDILQAMKDRQNPSPIE